MTRRGNYSPAQEAAWAKHRHECLVRWIVDHPEAGRALLDRWDMMEPKKSYAAQVRADARYLWRERKPKTVFNE